MPLSAKDKYPAPHGFGTYFNHTDPQRRVDCKKGSMLAPLSADDIHPISADAMKSVQAALALLADLVEDREHNSFLNIWNEQLKEQQEEAQAIRRAAQGIVGIIRIKD